MISWGYKHLLARSAFRYYWKVMYKVSTTCRVLKTMKKHICKEMPCMPYCLGTHCYFVGFIWLVPYTSLRQKMIFLTICIDFSHYIYQIYTQHDYITMTFKRPNRQMQNLKCVCHLNTVYTVTKHYMRTVIKVLLTSSTSKHRCSWCLWHRQDTLVNNYCR